MPKLFAVLMLSSVLAAQAAPELVVSVGHSRAPDHATFVGSYYLASASSSNVAIIDLSSGLTVSHLPQGALVEALEVNRAGDLLAVGTCGHALHVWNVGSRTLVRRIALTQECAESISFSPDGALLATGAYSCCWVKGLQIWDVHTGNLTRVLAEASAIRHVVFSGNGKWVASVDDRGNATVFEWPSGRELRTFQGLGMSGYSGSAAIASRDGQYFGWLGNGLRVFDLSSGSEIPLPGARQVQISDKPPGGVERRRTEQQVTANTAEFLNDGRLAYVDGYELILMRLPDGPRQIVPLSGVATAFGSWLKIRRDGLLLAGTRDSQTVVWERAGSLLRELTSPALTSPASLSWSRSGLVAWGDLESGVRVWDDRAGRPQGLGSVVDSATAIAFRPDGARLAVSGLSSMSVIDITRRRAIASRDLPRAGETGVAFSLDGLSVAFVSLTEGFGIFDGNLRPRGRIEPMDNTTTVEHVAFSPDGRWIAAGLAGAAGMALRVWPVLGSGAGTTLNTERLIHGPQPPAFSSDSRRLASFGRDRSLIVWSAATWNVARTWTLQGTGRALAFAPEGARLAVAGDGEAAIWDADAGRKLVTFSSQGSSESTGIAWSPDGRRVVTSADDGVLRFWSATDGRLLALLYLLSSGDDWLLVSPDGRLDGSENALARLVAWRVGDRVAAERAVTQARRVPGFWRSLSTSPRP